MRENHTIITPFIDEPSAIYDLAEALGPTPRSRPGRPRDERLPEATEEQDGQLRLAQASA